MLSCNAGLWSFFSKKNVFFALLLLFWSTTAVAQQEEKIAKDFFVKIDSITIEGNKRTRKALILRELEFTSGDSILVADLTGILERNRLRVLNLGIFSDASLTISNWEENHHTDLHIKVNEAWYWFPSPVFELVDRNFNVWWTEFNHSLKRANFGGDYTQYNFTGHADVLNLTATTGYNQRLHMRYRTPSLNKKQTLGLQFGASYSRTDEVAVKTEMNKLVFFSYPGDFAIRRLSFDVMLTWRPGLFYTHGLSLENRQNFIADTIIQEINPLFFSNGKSAQKHFSFAYTFNFDNRDIRPYPTKGWSFLFELRQNGLLPADDLFLTRVRLEVSKYTPFSSWLSLETGARIRFSLPRSRPPYFNNQALGYGSDLVRGYEYYVMDGLDLGVIKTSLRGRFVKRMIFFPDIVKARCNRCKPFEVKAYWSIQNDFGYANDPWFAFNNPLSNRVLYAYGIGLDIIMFYTKTMQISWMRTITGQSGIYVRTTL